MGGLCGGAKGERFDLGEEDAGAGFAAGCCGGIREGEEGQEEGGEGREVHCGGEAGLVPM